MLYMIYLMPENFTPSSSYWKRFLAALVSLALKLVNNGLALCALLLWSHKRPRDSKRVLIYRIGNIGDLVCALPALRAVRRAYPDAHLTLLTSSGCATLPGAKDLLPEVAWIDEILNYGREDIGTVQDQWRLAMTLRRRRYDVWVHLPMELTTVRRELRDMGFAWLCGPRWARGWGINTLRWAVQAQSQYMQFPPEVDRLNTIVGRVGFANSPVEFGLPRTEAVQSRVDVLMPQIGASESVAIAPGCKRSTNRWPTERFAMVGAFLVQQGVRVVMLGGASDTPECEAIASAIGPQALSLAGQLSLPESIEVLRRCRLAVCVDSGVQHLASAVGTPTVSLFSFWQMPGKWTPYGPNNVVLQRWVPCHTCLLAECPHGNRCMKAIEADDVIREVAAKLRAVHYRVLDANSLDGVRGH